MWRRVSRSGNSSTKRDHGDGMQRIFFLLLSAALLTVPPSTNSLTSGRDRLIVETPQGLLRGAGQDLRAFKGIPYASPPVGPSRWKPPRPGPSWAGTRDASRPGPACMQPPSYAHIARTAMSEDCLYLNVWTPAQRSPQHLPVLVWIHGGGFVVGSGSMKEDDGENLARKGVVVVTINYRLGVFGFLAHPDLTRESPHHSSGNYGLLDQIAALRWVKSNIAAFGGDPDNVTVAGQSAGATSIGYLLVSPLARGLFQRAIVESPARSFVPAPELDRSFKGLLPAEDVGRAIGRNIAGMRRWNSDEVMQHAAEVTDRLFPPEDIGHVDPKTSSHVLDRRTNEQPWWPFIDGWVVPRQLAQSYAQNRQISVPLLIGTNTNEGSIFVIHFLVKTEQTYRAYLEENFAPCAAAMFHLYPAYDPAEIHARAEKIYTDAYFLYGARSLAQAERREQAKVFLYRFTHVGPDEKLAKLGAWHGSELAYVFGHTTGDSSRRFNAQDHAISEELMNTWVRFATVGDPDRNGFPYWPAWNSKKEDYMAFGDSPHIRSIENTHRFRIFDQVFSIEPDDKRMCRSRSDGDKK